MATRDAKRRQAEDRDGASQWLNAPEPRPINGGQRASKRRRRKDEGSKPTRWRRAFSDADRHDGETEQRLARAEKAIAQQAAEISELKRIVCDLDARVAAARQVRRAKPKPRSKPKAKKAAR